MSMSHRPPLAHRRRKLASSSGLKPEELHVCQCLCVCVYIVGSVFQPAWIGNWENVFRLMERWCCHMPALPMCPSATWQCDSFVYFLVLNVIIVSKLQLCLDKFNFRSPLLLHRSSFICCKVLANLFVWYSVSCTDFTVATVWIWITLKPVASLVVFDLGTFSPLL